MTASKKLTPKLVQTLETIHVHLPDNDDDAWQMVVDGLNASTMFAAKTGLVLIALKEKLPKGKFIEGLDAMGIAKRTAQEAMAIGRALMALPDAKARAIAHLGKKKLTQIARLDPEAIEELVDGGEVDGKTLDDIDVMSTRELKAHLRATKKDLTRAELKLDKQRLKAISDKAVSAHQYPETVTKIRIESSAATDMAVTCMDDLAALVNMLLDADDLSFEPSDRETEFMAASTVLTLNIKQVVAKAALLLDFLNEHFEETATELSLDNPVLLDDSEMQIITDMRNFLYSSYSSDKDLRKVNTPSKRVRGRPRKSK